MYSDKPNSGTLKLPIDSNGPRSLAAAASVENLSVPAVPA